MQGGRPAAIGAPAWHYNTHTPACSCRQAAPPPPLCACRHPTWGRLPGQGRPPGLHATATRLARQLDCQLDCQPPAVLARIRRSVSRPDLEHLYDIQNRLDKAVARVGKIKVRLCRWGACAEARPGSAGTARQRRSRARCRLSCTSRPIPPCPIPLTAGSTRSVCLAPTVCAGQGMPRITPAALGQSRACAGLSPYKPSLLRCATPRKARAGAAWPRPAPGNSRRDAG